MNINGFRWPLSCERNEFSPLTPLQRTHIIVGASGAAYGLNIQSKCGGKSFEVLK